MKLLLRLRVQYAERWTTGTWMEGICLLYLNHNEWIHSSALQYDHRTHHRIPSLYRTRWQPPSRRLRSYQRRETPEWIPRMAGTQPHPPVIYMLTILLPRYVLTSNKPSVIDSHPCRHSRHPMPRRNTHQCNENTQIHMIDTFWPSFGLREFIPILLQYQRKVWNDHTPSRGQNIRVR